MNLSKQEIDTLANQVVDAVVCGGNPFEMLKPILDTKCPFAKLDMLGHRIGTSGSVDSQKFFKLFDTIIEYNAMGGFVIVGQALIHFLPYTFEKVMEKSKEYIIKGDVWYVCDIIGERSIGHAVVEYFDESILWLQTFLDDDNKWVKRSAGVAIHFFSKRVVDQPEKTKILLQVVEPYLEEKQKDFVKGIGWGLKTIGKHHPDILVDFIKKQAHKNMSALLIKKAVTYLEEEKKNEIKKVLQG
jgi:3-methyladenine DNA glycosylase AlkD